MTPIQKLRHAVLLQLASWDPDLIFGEITAENVDDLYNDQEETEGAKSEIRGGQFETGLPSQRSRHYESKEVAAKMPDGSWVGWTYWYGGGKHGEPESIDWMEEAYDVQYEEEEKMVTVYTFTKQ